MSAPGIPNCLTIAGSDSGGGAGIQADIKAFSANGVYSASVLTALTAQNTQGVTAIHDVPVDFVAAQMDAVFADIKISAVKIGMLSQSSVIQRIAERLAFYQAPAVVLDPVMVAASGAPLLADDAESDIIKHLFPVSSLVTPNLLEAAKILNCPPARSSSDMQAQAEQLVELGARAVLLKGGHGTQSAESSDLLVCGKGLVRWYKSVRHATQNTHGTGCTLSSAIAAHLAKGQDLETAIGSAKAYICEAIRCADALCVGEGFGPVHHFHALWD